MAELWLFSLLIQLSACLTVIGLRFCNEKKNKILVQSTGETTGYIYFPLGIPKVWLRQMIIALSQLQAESVRHLRAYSTPSDGPSCVLGPSATSDWCTANCH